MHSVLWSIRYLHFIHIVQYVYLITSILMPLLWLTIILFCMHNLTRTQFNSLSCACVWILGSKNTFFLHVVDIQLVIIVIWKDELGISTFFLICLFHFTHSFTSSQFPLPPQNTRFCPRLIYVISAINNGFWIFATFTLLYNVCMHVLFGILTFNWIIHIHDLIYSSLRYVQ